MKVFQAVVRHGDYQQNIQRKIANCFSLKQGVQQKPHGDKAHKNHEAESQFLLW